MSHLNAGRWQFVWWGWSAGLLNAHRYEGSLAAIYDWSVSVGPLEIRQWHRAAPSSEDR